jgi:hypothetical protein
VTSTAGGSARILFDDSLPWVCSERPCAARRLRG